MCRSTKIIPKMMLLSATGADQIFCKQLDADGFIYVLKFNRKRQKRHEYIETRIACLDVTLMSMSNSLESYFASIGTEDGSSSKVRSFGRNGRLKDPFFLEIFNSNAPRVDKDFQTKAGVLMWSKDQQEPGGFDVVKKRKAMEAGEGENDAAALVAFEEFEMSVLPALENIRLDEVVDFHLCDVKLLSDCRGIFITGGVSSQGGVRVGG